MISGRDGQLPELRLLDPWGSTRTSASMAGGVTTGDIAKHLSDVYDTVVSRDLVSRVTDQIIEDMRAWESRHPRSGLT